jgi:type II secretory pathway pseudopilin PulG
MEKSSMKDLSNMKRSPMLFSKGQSLIEMLVVLGLVVLLVTSVVVGSTASLRNQQLSANRDAGLKYAQQGMETIRSLRDADWTTFVSYSGSWCLNQDGTLVAFVDACSELYNDIYQRVVTFTWDSVNERMNIQMVVSWTLGSKSYSVKLESFFTDWRS